MKLTTIILSLVLVGTSISCSQTTADNSRHFSLSTSDMYVKCPKCGSNPKALVYHQANHDTFECDMDGSIDGSGSDEHFMVICSFCGMRGWSTIEEGKASISAHNNSNPNFNNNNN